MLAADVAETVVGVDGARASDDGGEGGGGAGGAVTLKG